MTKKERLNFQNPFHMLRSLEWKEVSERKLRLFLVAFYRCHRELFVDPHTRRAVEVAELLADGLATEDERAAIHAVCEHASHTSTDMSTRCLFRAAAGAIARNVPAPDAELGGKLGPIGAIVMWGLANISIAVSLRRIRQRVSRGRNNPGRSSCSLKRNLRDFAGRMASLHDILGNLFCLVSVTPAWLSWHEGLLVSMAQRMYDTRDFADMPILADALEEAGCDNADILNHCRQPGKHVRGCWVVDLLLNKS